jgi:hypothetical protein
MKQIQRGEAKGRVAKSVLRLPDLEVAKSAVLNSLSCPDAQRGYRRTQSFAAAVNDKIGIESASWLIGPLAESRTTRSGTMRMLAFGNPVCFRSVMVSAQWPFLSFSPSAPVPLLVTLHRTSVELAARAEKALNLRQVESKDPCRS